MRDRLTVLSPVQNGSIWRVRIAWPIGTIHHFWEIQLRERCLRLDRRPSLAGGTPDNTRTTSRQFGAVNTAEVSALAVCDRARVGTLTGVWYFAGYRDIVAVDWLRDQTVPVRLPSILLQQLGQLGDVRRDAAWLIVSGRESR